jgi:acetyl esterase/lipase
VNDRVSKIHPELRSSAKRFPRIVYNRKTVWLFRLLTRLMPSPGKIEGLHVENVFIPRQDGRTNIRLRIYKPGSTYAPTPALIWMHGGGHLIGKPEQDDGSCAQFVRELGITVISVDYRLSPQYPFPAALDDCHSALQWAASHPEESGIDPARIAVGGASAGGGLAAALAQLAHDRKEIEPAFQLLVYPMLDDRTVLRMDIADSRNITWDQQSNRYGWESYLGRECGADEVPAYSVPARRTDLSGLPPAWIGVGDLDIFHAEGVAYANRLRERGVACELEVIPGAFHGFDVFGPQIPVVQKFRRSQIAALKKHLF